MHRAAPEHTAALENVVLAQFTTDRPCHRKANRPPGDTALALAAELLGDRGADPVIDLAVYRRVDRRRRVMSAATRATSSSAAISPTSSWPPRPKRCPASSTTAMKPSSTHTAFLERLLAVEVAAVEARRHAGLLRFATSRRRGGSTTSTSAPNHPSTAALMRELATLRLRRRRHQRAVHRTARRRQDDARRRPRPRSVDAGYAPTTPPPPTSPPAAAKPPSKDAGPPPCGSSPDPACSSSTRSATCRCPPKPPTPCSKSSRQRYLRGSIILTTNLGVASWGDIFDDPTVAAAMLDRLLHRSVVININGDSYRMRTHRARHRTLTHGDDT